MSKEKEQSEEAGGAEDKSQDATLAPEETQAGGERNEMEDMRAELEQARAKADKYWDKLARASAELENLHKRSEREVANAHKYALEKFARDLLGVRDSLEMGIASAREEGGADKHVEGMELTLKMLVGTMERFDIRELNPEGEPFNPEFHEAVSTQEAAETPANSVLQVMQKGYLLNDRVLRPAMVVVARAPS